MSNEIAGSHEVVQTRGGSVKKNKHAIHIQWGCRNFNCTVCFNGQPFQMYINKLKGVRSV